MKTLHFVNGGVGKSIIFTSLLNKLKEKYEEDISICSYFSDVFAFNKNVDKVHTNIEYFNHTSNKINYGHYDEIINKDPYYSNYIFDDNHIIKSWFDLYDLKYENDEADLEISELSKRISEKYNNTKFLILQFTGGQSVPNNNDNYDVGLFGFRNYNINRAQKLISIINTYYPNVPILNFSYPNEYNFHGIEKYFGNFIGIQTLLKNSLGFISIDSSLQHLAATKQIKKNGIVLWNSNITLPEKIGYDTNINLVYNEHTEIDIDEFEIFNYIKNMIDSNL